MGLTPEVFIQPNRQIRLILTFALIADENVHAASKMKLSNAETVPVNIDSYFLLSTFSKVHLQFSVTGET